MLGRRFLTFIDESLKNNENNNNNSNSNKNRLDSRN